MASRTVTLNTDTWTQISASGDTSLTAALPKIGVEPTILQSIAICVETSAANCTVDKSFLLSRELPAMAAIPIGSGEEAYALWVGYDGFVPLSAVVLGS